ncbi:MAG: peptidylprolyl isomerase [Hoeflea sp.]|nr:peptidylprolyl isomerase [Hoeflea sp.]|tara:strand:- start:4548 stop:6431 length:1884 start_codon:yes stop_codon:yes gene_type:complete
MLDTLRDASKGWVAKLLLILLVAAFGVWGISGSMFTAASNSVVTVGDTTVTPNEYRLAYDRQMASIGRQMNTRLTSEQAKAFGIPQRTFGEVIAGAALDEQARRMNLGLSDDRLAKLVADDPAFHDFNGRFDRGNFTQVLRSVGMSEAEYIESRSKVAVRAQIVEAVSDGFQAPDAMIEALAAYQSETRDVNYILLTPDVLEAGPEPDDAAVEAYYEEHKADYEAPEYRKITYVTLKPEDIADPASISKETVRQDYEANKAKFSTPEQRSVDQLVFPDQAAADEAAAKLESGTSFDDLATEMGRNPNDMGIGSFTKEDAPSAAIGEAVFNVAETGGTTGVVDGPFGPVILRVSDIKAGAEKSLEEMEPEIRKELALTEAYDQVMTVHDNFEDALAGGTLLSEAATQQKLPMRTVEAVDRAGRDPSGKVINDIPESRDLLQGAFEADVNVELPPINIGSDGYVWYQVDEVTPARQKPLDEVRDQVIADWKAEKANEALGAKATEVADKVKNGESLDMVAAELGVAVEQKYSLKRGDEDPVFGQAAVEAAFGGPQGLAGVAADAGGQNRIVFKVMSVNSGSGADAVQDQDRQQISARVADDLLDQMVTELRDTYGVSINQTLAERAISY